MYVMMRFFILVCATGVLLRADGPGVTTAFSPPLMNGIIGQQSMAYNSTDNQYCLVWLDEAGFNNINCALYNPDGTPASAQTSLSNAAQSPYICYNSTNNQYFIAWAANDNIQFIVIDNATNVVVPVQSIPLSAGLFAGADVTCCYNSVSNEYCITWIEWDGATPPSQLYFALVDATGAVVKGETEISSGAGLAAGDALTPFVTYNSRKNEYFFTWFGTDGTNNYLLFALYDAGGNAITSAQVIPQFTGYGLSGNTPFSCYNTVTNQYFVTWVASPPTLGQAYPFYAIYNSSGAVVVPTTAVTPQQDAFQINSTPVCSYNMHDNIYFLSWSDVSNPVVAATLAADGSIINGYIVIPVVSGGNPEGLVFNVFGINPAEYFIVWHTADHIAAFYNIFIIDPPIPTQFTGKKRLNRFINYGEYFVNLSWQPSISLYLQSYKIYRNGAFIARVSPLATFISLHNQPRQGSVYGVQAVNSFGGTNTAQVLI